MSPNRKPMTPDLLDSLAAALLSESVGPLGTRQTLADGLRDAARYLREQAALIRKQQKGGST